MAGFSGHYSGLKTNFVNATIWMAQLPSPMSFDNLYDSVTGRRVTRAKSPNGNPETTFSGFFPASSSLVWHSPTQHTPPETIAISSPARLGDPFFPTYQLGVGGSCAQFDPPEGFWCSSNPPAGNQYVVPSGITVPPFLFPTEKNWSYAGQGAIFHAFHCDRWGDWKFAVDKADPHTGNITWTLGGFQEARGCANGDSFMMESLLDFLDDYDEWYLQPSTNILYVMRNNSDPPPSDNTTYIATHIDCLIRLEGSVEDVVHTVTLSGVTFSHSSPTFMKSFLMPSGGDWSVHRDAAVVLQGTEGVVVENCSFIGIGGNAVLITAYNRDAFIGYSQFRFVGDSAIVSVGNVNGIDGLLQDVPINTRIVSNIASEIGLYVKQSGFYYHALSANATVDGNIFFNMPRAGININGV